MWKIACDGSLRTASLLNRRELRHVLSFFTSTSNAKKDDDRTLFSEDPVASAKNRVLHSRQAFKAKGEQLRTQLDAAKTVIRRRVEVIRRENIWTIPNILCLSRIVVCPYLGYIILSEQYPVSLGIFVVAGLSDVCDGYIARTYKSQATVLGSLLDPLADKLLIGTMYISMTWAGLVPAALTWIVLGRDVLLTSAGLYLRFASLPKPKTLADFFDPSLPTVRVQPSRISKFNTLVQVTSAAVSLALPAFSLSADWSPLLLMLWYTTAATTTASFVSYVMTSSSAYKVLKQSKNKFPP